MNNTDPQRMQCMEVWGGNQAVERHFNTPGLSIWLYSRTFEHAHGGGDVYYVSSCASGRITRILLADVSGHGEMVSEVAVGLRELMRRNVNYINQTKLVRSMNKQFAGYAEHEAFATALVTTFFSPMQSLAISNAGHPAPMLFRNGSSEWTELKGQPIKAASVSDLPLGIVAESEYTQREVRLETGDMVLAYSDAVPESLDHEGRQLGQVGVLKLLRELSVENPAALIPSLVKRIEALSPENLAHDDATLLLFQASGGGPSLKDNLLAPFRLLRPVSDRTTLSE